MTIPSGRCPDIWTPGWVSFLVGHVHLLRFGGYANRTGGESLDDPNGLIQWPNYCFTREFENPRTICRASADWEIKMSRFAKGLFLSSSCLFIACTMSVAAVAMDQGQFANAPERIRDWFKSAKGPNGGACCDLADGHRTEYDMREDHYWVPIEGAWIEVPAQAVIHNAQNPTGEGVVWYSWRVSGNVEAPIREPLIRCFAPAVES
jgi:hypothetical protein